MVSRLIYNLKIETIYMYDIPFDRSFLQLSNGIRYVMLSTDPKPELTAKASMAQPVSQPAVYANGLRMFWKKLQATVTHLLNYFNETISNIYMYLYSMTQHGLK
jgi:hypothetical protein